MIELERVSKTYPTANGSVRALDDVSLSIADGEFVAVRGPSGCGKSTLLAVAGGLCTPSAGRVEVAGHEISVLSADARARFRAESIGFVFQLFHLLPYLNMVDNVALAARPNGDRRAARDLLSRVGLAGRLRHRAAELSAGERQRVAVARALINRPRLILADEPTGNLDPESAKIVLDLLAEYHREGGTVLLVTHDDLATGYAQRVVSLRAGAVEAALS